MEFSEDYPIKAPKVRFVTKMFHPNSCVGRVLGGAGLFPAGAVPMVSTAVPSWGHLQVPRALSLSHTHFHSLCLSRSLCWLHAVCPAACAVYNDGQICLDILQNKWSSIYDVVAILSSLQVCVCATLLSSPVDLVWM